MGFGFKESDNLSIQYAMLLTNSTNTIKGVDFVGSGNRAGALATTIRTEKRGLLGDLTSKAGIVQVQNYVT